MKKSAVINSDDCIGCGSCVDICSDAFGFDESETNAIVKKRGEGNDECIEEAMESYPSQCISWSSDKCESCEKSLTLCYEVFSLNKNENITEVVLPEGYIEGCLEEAIES